MVLYLCTWANLSATLTTAPNRKALLARLDDLGYEPPLGVEIYEGDVHIELRPNLPYRLKDHPQALHPTKEAFPSLEEDTGSMRNDPEWADLEFSVEGINICAHTAIVCKRCPYLSAMVRHASRSKAMSMPTTAGTETLIPSKSNFKDDIQLLSEERESDTLAPAPKKPKLDFQPEPTANRNMIRLALEKITHSQLQRILEYIYSDSVSNLEWAEAGPLLSLADEWMLPGLKAQCESVLAERLFALRPGINNIAILASDWVQIIHWAQAGAATDLINLCLHRLATCEPIRMHPLVQDALSEQSHQVLEALSDGQNEFTKNDPPNAVSFILHPVVIQREGVVKMLREGGGFFHWDVRVDPTGAQQMTDTLASKCCPNTHRVFTDTIQPMMDDCDDVTSSSPLVDSVCAALEAALTKDLKIDTIAQAEWLGV